MRERGRCSIWAAVAYPQGDNFRGEGARKDCDCGEKGKVLCGGGGYGGGGGGGQLEKKGRGACTQKKSL